MRWTHVGTGPIADLSKHGGPDAKTAKGIAENPRRDLERNNDSQMRLVKALRFARWEDLDGAWKQDDVLRDIGVVLSPGAFETARREASARRMSVEDWVNRIVVDAGKPK